MRREWLREPTVTTATATATVTATATATTDGVHPRVRHEPEVLSSWHGEGRPVHRSQRQLWLGHKTNQLV